MHWRMAPGKTFNKSRDVYVEVPLIYDPKNLCLVVDDEKLAIDYGRAQSALSGTSPPSLEKPKQTHFTNVLDTFVSEAEDDSDEERRRATKED